MPYPYGTRSETEQERLEGALEENSYHRRVNITGAIVSAITAAGLYYATLSAQADIEEYEQGIERIAKAHARDYIDSCTNMIKSENPGLQEIIADEAIESCAYERSLEQTQSRYDDPLNGVYALAPTVAGMFCAAAAALGLYNLRRAGQRTFRNLALKKQLEKPTPPGA